jgi:hypothetical protein
MTDKPAKPDAEKLLQERFEQRVVRGGPDECWRWMGAVDTEGYGRLTVKGGRYRAHRVALSLATPPASPDLHACHHCDNPGCVNPAHLFWGTNTDNMRDKTAKGRNISPFPVKLTEDDVRHIRRLYADGAFIRALGRQFGVTARNISQVVKRQTWKDVA